MKQAIFLIFFLTLSFYEAKAAQTKNSSLYEMNKEQLLEVDSDLIQQEIKILEEKQKEDKNSLEKLKKFNESLCNRFKKLETQCQGMAFIADSYGFDDLSCGSDEQKSSSSKMEMLIELKNDHGHSFVLIANDKYVSSEINAQNMNQPITFKRTDSRLVKPPRLRDLTSLQIVSIKRGGSYGERVQRPEDLSITIKVSGKNLMDDFTLIKPEDEIDISSFRINPKGLIELKSKKECIVDLSEINQLMGK